MKKRFSIQIMFTLIIAGIVTICISGIGIFTWISINNSWHTQTEFYTKQLTRRYMYEVISIMQNVYDTNKTLAHSYEMSGNIPAANISLIYSKIF